MFKIPKVKKTHRLLFSLSLAMLWAASPTLLAQQRPEKKVPVKKGKQPPLASVENPDSSRQIRSTKIADVGVKAITTFIGLNTAGVGIEANYFLSEKIQFGFCLASGSNSEKPQALADANAIVIDSYGLKGQLALANVRWFIGNSFYAALGFGARNFQFDYGISIKNSSASNADTVGATAASMKVNSFVAALSLGNIWTLRSGLYLGGEWISLQQPLFSKNSSSTTASGIITAAEREDIANFTQDQADKLGKTVSVNALAFLIGYQF